MAAAGSWGSSAGATRRSTGTLTSRSTSSGVASSPRRSADARSTPRPPPAPARQCTRGALS
eukprot:5222665-Lingulodinium_polyedra.AAC.1